MDEKKVEPVAQQTEPTLTVPTQVAVQLKVLEFDKVIAEAKAQVANLEAQKAKFLYDTNLISVQQQYQQVKS